jgi:outer membrane protein TolC
MFSYQLNRVSPRQPIIQLLAILFLALEANSACANNVTLNDLIVQALSSYPTILARQSSRDAAKTDLTVAKLKFLPNPSVNTQRNQVAYNNSSVTNLPATNVTISQPIFIGGSLIAGYDKANARLSAADFTLLETREECRTLVTLKVYRVELLVLETLVIGAFRRPQ